MQLTLKRLHVPTWLNTSGAHTALYAQAGLAMGWSAWGDGRWPLAVCLLPALLATAPSRLAAFTMAFGYLLATERVAPQYIANWFGISPVWGAAGWLLAALAGAAAWCTAWTTATSLDTKVWRVGVAWSLALLPPAALFAFGHPIVAWGFLLPGSAWMGVALSLALPAGLIHLLAYCTPWTGRALLLALLMCLSGLGWVKYEPTQTRHIANMAAVNTRWGVARTTEEMIHRLERIGAVNKSLETQTDIRVIIYPESILETYESAFFPVLKMEVLDPAQRAGQTLILGADITLPNGDLESAAMVFYPDGSTSRLAARQPMPFALWHPWAAGSFPAYWWPPNVISVKPGVEVAVYFCYEELLPLLSLITELRYPHSLRVTIANNWAAPDDQSTVMQARHSEGMAKLFRHRLLRAENRMENLQ